MTFQEIGERLGLSKPRVEQLHSAALRKIRNALRGDWNTHRLFADEVDYGYLGPDRESE